VIYEAATLADADQMSKKSTRGEAIRAPGDPDAAPDATLIALPPKTTKHSQILMEIERTEGIVRKEYFVI
jgi:hypothetical protein